MKRPITIIGLVMTAYISFTIVRQTSLFVHRLVMDYADLSSSSTKTTCWQ